MNRKIAYLGIDLLQCALRTVLEEGCQVLKVFTCRTDNVTEFNTGVLEMARVHNVPTSLEPVTPADLDWLAEQGCELLLCGGYYHRLPITGAFPMVNIHPAPLPAYRGAWPMPIMLLRGERRGGVVLHKMAEQFDCGDLLLEREFPLAANATLADYMAQAEQVLPDLVRQLLYTLPDLLVHARPQGEGVCWPCPTEKDWTITPEMTAAEADAILRAFYGYECLYRAGERTYELIGGRVFPQPGQGNSFPVKNGWVQAPGWRNWTGMDELQTRVDRLRHQAGHTLAAYGFPSLWLWKEHMGLQLWMEEGAFAVQVKEWGKNAWFFPCGSEEGKLAFLREHAGDAGTALFYLRGEDAAWLEEHFPGQWVLSRCPDADEYLYLREPHIAMEGGRFKKLRCHVHKIERKMSPRTEILHAGNTDDARRILDEWTPGGSLDWGGDDRQVALRALEQREALGLHGIVVYLEDRPAAFMLGFPLADDAYDVAVSKYAVHVQGITYYTLRELMRSLPAQYRWFNLEEDLGLPGLREMKEHFLPDGKHEIWEAWRR